MKTIQAAEIISEGGRGGKAEASDGSLSVSFAQGSASSKGGVTPEHLFAAAYSSCFHSAVLNHATKGHFKVVGSTVTAKVMLQENERGEYQLAVELKVALPGVSRSDAEHLINQAHTTCPYSKALRHNVQVSLSLD